MVWRRDGKLVVGGLRHGINANPDHPGYEHIISWTTLDIHAHDLTTATCVWYLR